MNTIQQIPLQNQQDFWAMLYMHIGKSILDVCGRRGEKAIRQALREISEEDGRMFLQECEKQGVKPNLHSLYAMGCACSADPRVRSQVLCDQEQMRLWEVYTCPLANLWQDADQAFLGNLYCEENQLGLIDAFTHGRGQFHVTKKILCHRTNGCRPDNYCRFSAYYRAANVEKDQRNEIFSEDESTSAPAPVCPQDFQTQLRRKCIRTLTKLAATAQAEFGAEGLCAVALGLRNLVQPTAEMMLHYADATLNQDMEAFLRANLPVTLDPGQDPDWDSYGDACSRQLFESDFAIPLKKLLTQNA